MEWTNSLTVVFKCCDVSFTHRERNITDVGILFEPCKCNRNPTFEIIGSCDNEHYPRSFTAYFLLDEKPEIKRIWDMDDIRSSIIRFSQHEKSNTNVNRITADVVTPKCHHFKKKKIQIVVASDIRDLRYRKEHTMGLILNTRTPMSSNIGDEHDAEYISHYYTKRNSKSIDEVMSMYERCLSPNNNLFWIDEGFRRRLQRVVYPRTLVPIKDFKDKSEYYAMFPEKTYGEPFTVILNTIQSKV